MPNPLSQQHSAQPAASQPAPRFWTKPAWTKPVCEVIPLDCEITAYAPDGEPLPF